MKTVFLESHNIKNPYFGFGQFNLHLIRALAKLEHSNYEITLHVSDIATLKKEFGKKFNYKKYRSFSRYSLFRIRKKYDVWHAMNQNTKIEPFHDLPYVLTVHDVHFATENDAERLQRFKEKLRRASVITYISEYAKKETHAHFEVPKIPERVIYNGNPILEIRELSNYRPTLKIKKPFFFSIGDFLERKNFHALVEMMQFLPDWNLIISGNHEKAYGEKIKAQIEKKQLQDRVLLTGKIGEQEKQYFMQNCTAFLFPSLREGFGLPPIEAMRFGKPVFLSNLTSLPEIGGEVAYYWDDFAPENMKERLLEGLSHFEKNKSEMQRKLIARAKFFSWDKAAAEYSQTYESLF